jgi:RecT family
MTMTDIAPSEQRIAERINSSVTGELAVSNAAGGLEFVNMNQAMEFAKMMSISSVAVPKHLRSNPGACLAVVIQAIEWRLSPYAVANKSYSVNDRLAYESQLIQAVILQRAPIVGRFKVEYTGEGDNRVCKVWARLKDGEETVEYISPPFGKITPKNSPLWKSDPDQQHFYYSGRALCRRHFPDVLLGVYADDEILPPMGPDGARDVTPAKSIGAKLDDLAGLPSASSPSTGSDQVDPETGEVTEQTKSAASSTATGEPSSAGATEAGQADPNQGPDKASPADNSASPQKGGSIAPNASGQAAPESNPSQEKDKGAAKAGDKAATPKNEAEYVAATTAWIDALDDAAAGEKRWLDEKKIRNSPVSVGSDAREALQTALATKCREIRDADRS